MIEKLEIVFPSNFSLPTSVSYSSIERLNNILRIWLSDHA